MATEPVNIQPDLLPCLWRRDSRRLALALALALICVNLHFAKTLRVRSYVGGRRSSDQWTQRPLSRPQPFVQEVLADVHGLA